HDQPHPPPTYPLSLHDALPIYDYLVKPFSMKELVARVKAAVRRGVRAQDAPRGDAIEIEELRIDPREVQAFVAGSSADLTPTELDRKSTRLNSSHLVISYAVFC